MDNSRTISLIGEDNFAQLANAHVTIVGVGGVGGYAAMLLARAGVGKLKLVDFDEVSSSNLNRQIVATTKTIGQKKVDVLKNMIEEAVDTCKVEAVCQRMEESSCESLLSETDYVVDAIDSVKDKVALIIYCHTHNSKIVSAMGAGNRYDIPNFYLTDIYKTHDDGLAKVVRKKLREAGIKTHDVVTSSSKAEKKEIVASISYYPAAAGATLAAVVVNKLLKG